MLPSHGEAPGGSSRLLPAGWAVAVVVAVLAYVAKPEDELGFMLVAGSLAASMALWTLRRSTRRSAAVSLALGALWLLMFGAYTVAGFTSDETNLVRATDVLAVVGGVLIVWGAIGRLRADGS